MLENIFKNVFEMTLSASFLIVAVFIARIALHKSSKLFRKVLWGLVAFKLLMPFSLESALSLVPDQSEYLPDSTFTYIGDEQAVAVTEMNLKSIWPYVWFVVFLLFLAYGIVSFLRLKYKISDAVLLESNVFLSEKIESPFVFGIFKPKIYIPYKVNNKDLDCVLEHEKTHIKYFDHITKLLGFAILCVHWFNPLVWISYVLFCKDVELACDEIVVKNMPSDKRKDYALALYDIGINKTKISACPIAFGEVSVKERIKKTLSYKKIGKMAIVLSVFLCVTVAVCFMTSPKSKALTQAKKTVSEELPVAELQQEQVTVPTTRSAEEIPVVEKETEIVAESTIEAVTQKNSETTAEYYEVSSATKKPSVSLMNDITVEPVSIYWDFIRDERVAAYNPSSDSMYDQAVMAGIIEEDEHEFYEKVFSEEEDF